MKKMKLLFRFPKIVFVSLSLIFLSADSLFSQNMAKKPFANKSWTVKPFERKAFIENKGQFENNLPENKKTFNYAIDKGYQVFFYPSEISYRFTKYVKSKETLIDKFKNEAKREAKEHEIKSQTQYVNVKWLDSNPNATIVVEDKQSTYYSYLIDNAGDKPATVMCAGYSKLIYKNLYKGIDVEYVFHPDNGIEYSLLIHPGADIAQVKMQYTGATHLWKDALAGDIHIPTLLGDIIDHAPVTFYANSKEKITSSFTINNNIVSFSTASYLKDQEIIVDPWTVVPGFTPPKAFDNGVDNSGNIYIYGGGGSNLVTEKYAPTGGAPIWSLVNGVSAPSYYGDMLVEGSGNFYLSDGFDPNGAHTRKFSPTSSLIWTSTSDPNYREHWRIALNCITNKVIVAGGGTTTPTLNTAEIDKSTGVLINAKSVYAGHEDIAGLCVDVTGKSFLIGAISNTLIFTDSINNVLSIVPDGYNLSEIGVFGTTSYYPGLANGYSMMALGGTTFLFTSDGATINKWDRNTYANLGSITIPGGQQNLGGGLLADKCNNVFAGASNGVYRFDFNLVQKEFHATSAAVYDIAYALNSDIVASGNGFLTPLPFSRQSCVSDTLLILSTNPCNSSINTVTIRPIQGVPPYVFLWDDGSTDSVRVNLSVGVHLVTVRDGACVPSFHTDSVKVVNSGLAVQKINPSCTASSNGQIKIILLKSQTITSVVWTPAITNTQPNDSTTKAVGLASGTYHCHLISSSGCSFDTTITLIAPPLLLDSLTGRRVKCVGDVNGSAKAYAYGGTGPYTYTWNTNPVQATQAASGLSVGKHIVTITDSNSCVKIDSVLIGSNPQPVANFSTQGVCVGDTSVFTNTSIVASGGYRSSWLMGYNGTSTTTRNTKYVYPLCNNYMATLVVTSDSGCVAAITDTVFVFCKPSASFTVNNVCTYKAAAFTNTSTGASSYGWDFDYNTGIDNTLQSPSHLYAPGNYTIKLIAHSSSGCSDTVVHGITVYSKPVAHFSTTSPCLGQSSVFTDSSMITGDTLTSWSWNFADTSPLGGTQNIMHTYLNPGTYPVSLIVSTNKGCKDTAILNVKIHALPSAKFSAINVCDGSVVPFNSLSTITAPDVIQSLAWNFADASQVDTNHTTTHLYATEGSYNVQLLTISNFGCRDSITKTIVVRPNPVVKFSGSDTVGCAPLCLSFTDLSYTMPGSSIVQWAWNCGDGSATGISKDFEHCYTNVSVDSNAYFTVTLIVTSDSGCVSTLAKNKYITVYPNPKAIFEVQPQSTTITEPLISITDLSLGGNSWTWNFGDQSFSSVFSPGPHIYNDTGSYTITLIASTQHGCADTANHTITIEPDFIFYIPDAFSPNGDGINDTFTGKGIYIKDYQMMIYDRWGNLVFFTNDIHKAWDGKANHGNETAQRDVYVYVVDVVDFKKKKHNYKGTVTLVR